MAEPTFKVVLNCGHSNRFVAPLPKPDDPTYCYRCADYQLAVFVDFPLANFRRQQQQGQMLPYCRKGIHEMVGDNVIRMGKSRSCRECKRERNREHRARKRRARVDVNAIK